VDKLSALVEEFITAVKNGDSDAKGWAHNTYGTSKAALNALTRVHARENKTKGVLINACCPGWCQTNMTSSAASRTAAEGAEVAVFLATAKLDSSQTGKFFHDNKETPFL